MSGMVPLEASGERGGDKGLQLPPKHHTPLVKCDSDPRGWRALQDLHDIEACPLHTLKKEEDLKKELEKTLSKATMDELINDAKIFQEIKDGAYDKDHMLKRLEKHCPEVAKSVVDVCKDHLSVDAAKFIVAADMYTKLNKVALLRKYVVYKRIKDAEEKKTDQSLETSWFDKAIYIVFPPVVMFILAFGFQSFMLHVATHFYIIYMDEGPDKRQQEGGQLFDLVGNWVAHAIVGTDPEGQGAVLEGAVKVPLVLLDLSGITPLFLCIVAFSYALYQKTFNIGLWNKTFIVASCMAVLKGVFDVVTILPDSIGWQACHDRLQEEGIEALRAFHFRRNPLAAAWSGIWAEIFPQTSSGKRVRYCADMMISGHTYFATLFALSAYKQVCFLGFPKSVRYSLGVVLSICLILEVILVAAARFHYTVDMLAALVLVVLLYDSSHIEQIAADWSEGFWYRPVGFKRSLVGFLFRHKESNPEFFKPEELLPSQSDLLNYRQMLGQAPWAMLEKPDKNYDNEGSERTTQDEQQKLLTT